MILKKVFKFIYSVVKKNSELKYNLLYIAYFVFLILSQAFCPFTSNEPLQSEACEFSIIRCCTSVLRWQW